MTGGASYDAIINALNRLTALLETLPPHRTEPFKFTSAQWETIKLQAAPVGSPFAWLTGTPVELVEDEADSTPIVEGWWTS